MAEKGTDTAVVLEPDDVAELAGFGSRGRVRHSHRFPIDMDRFTPLLGAQTDLARSVEEFTSGYIAVLGPPGSGKSTLLANTIPGLAARIVTYLAYLPGDSALAGRASASDFLHDLVTRLSTTGATRRLQLPPPHVNDLRLEFRELLKDAGEEYGRSGTRTIIVVDGLDHAARIPAEQPLLAELPLPEALPAGVVIVVGSQSAVPLDPRIQQHLRESTPEGPNRTVDLSMHRLSPSAVEDVCKRLARDTPNLSLTQPQINRIIDLVGGHPLALGYVCNALAGVVETHPLDIVESTGHVSNAAIDDALSECVRYSGSVVNDYAMYLAAGGDDNDLIELLGLLARIRPPIDIEWVKTWAKANGLARLKRVRHLFRRFDSRAWTFFHDSFRQYVIDETTVDLLGDPDPAANLAIHAALADECGRAVAYPRERGEELYHAILAQDDQRALGLATQANIRQRFIDGTASSLLFEDIRRALLLAGDLGDVRTIVALVLAHAELRAREFALESIDVAGLLLDVELPFDAVRYAICNGALQVPRQHALAAAVRLEEQGNAAGRAIFDAADLNDLTQVDSSDQWEVLAAWSRCVVRFRPIATLETVLRRLFDRTTAGSAAVDDKGQGSYIANHALHELWSTGRSEDAARIFTMLREYRDAIQAAYESSGSSRLGRLADAADEACQADLVQRLRILTRGHKWDEALSALDDNLGGRPVRNDWLNSHLIVASTDLALSLSRYSLNDIADPERIHDLRESALMHAKRLLTQAGPVLAVTSGDLSSASERMDPFGVAVRLRMAHMVLGMLDEAASGWQLTEEVLLSKLPKIDGPPRETPAGRDIARGAGAHRDHGAIADAKAIDHALTALATLQAALLLGGLDDASVRGLVNKFMSVLPQPPRRDRDLSRFRRSNTVLLEKLIEVAAAGPAELIRHVAAKLDGRTKQLEKTSQSHGSYDISYARGLRQTLALRLLDHGHRADWLADAMAAADDEVRKAAGAHERLETLVAQARAHALAGDISGAQAFARRLVPESLSPYSRKDYQLEEWVGWLLRASANDAGALLSEASELAPLLAALTEATEGAAVRAGETLLQGVASVAPRSGVRLASWQLRHGAVSFSGVASALISGCCAALAGRANGNSDELTDAAATLAAFLCAVYAVVGRDTPTDALESFAAILNSLPPGSAANLREQVARSIDVSVVGSRRADWRDALGLPPDGHKYRTSSEPAAVAKSSAGTHSRDWGQSEYGLLKTVEGELFDTDALRREVSDLQTARAWLARQDSPGTFAWAAVLKSIIATAQISDLAAIGNEFAGAYDAAEVHLLVADRLVDLGAAAAAAEQANLALAATELSGWVNTHGRGVRRRAWQKASQLEGDSVRRRATADLVRLIVSADYWPDMIMTELEEILQVASPSMAPQDTWYLVRDYLVAMRVGIAEPQRPNLVGAVNGSWWASDRSDASADTPAIDFGTTENSNPPSVLHSIVELLIILLDYPTWDIREGSAAALSSLVLRGDRSGRLATILLSQVLETVADHPVLIGEILDSDAQYFTDRLGDPDAPVTRYIGSDAPRARSITDAEIGLGGDSVREMAARAIFAGRRSAVDSDLRGLEGSGSGAGEPASAADAVWKAPSWTVLDARRQAYGRRPAVPHRPLPLSYMLRLPAPAAAPTVPFAKGGPYGDRLKPLAEACGIELAAVEHRFVRLTEIAERAAPKTDAIESAVRAVGLYGRYGSPKGFAFRAAFGRVVYEMVASGKLNVDDQGISAMLDVVDLGLVRQPYVPLPAWFPAPVVSDWIGAEDWLSGCERRIGEYKSLLDDLKGPFEEHERMVTLSSSVLSGSPISFGLAGAVLGARHIFMVTDRGRPTEEYRLSSRFSSPPSLNMVSSSGLLIPPKPTRPPFQIEVLDWLLSDGFEYFQPGVTSQNIGARNLMIATEPAILHTNSAAWTCLDPTVARALNWLPHPTLPLCWTDGDGTLMVATLLWRFASLDVGQGLHETVGEGSAVVASPQGLSALLSIAPIARAHKVERHVTESDETLDANPRSSAGDLAVLLPGV